MKIRKTKGFFAAPPTAFRDDKIVDFSVISPLAAHLQANGVAGVFVNGTTGEGMSLTVEERKQIAAEWRRVLPDGMKLFIHVGFDSVESAIELARHSQSIGADAIGVLAPGHDQTSGIEGLTEWCEPIAAAVVDMPFYVYYMPSVSGVKINAARFLEYALSRIPNLAGIKFTDEGLADYMEAAHLQNARFDMLWGRDEMLLGALSMGAKSGIGSTYNISCPLYLKIVEDYRKGDLDSARESQLKAIKMINIIVGSGNFFSALKAVLQSQGVPILPVTRNPLASLTTAQAINVCRDVEALGI